MEPLPWAVTPDEHIKGGAFTAVSIVSPAMMAPGESSQFRQPLVTLPPPRTTCDDSPEKSVCESFNAVINLKFFAGDSSYLQVNEEV